MEAHKLGCKFDGWSEHFSKEKWDKAAVNAGIDGAFFSQRPRYEDEILPWDKIDSGVTKEFLRKEWERAQECLITHDCRYGCVGCGVNRKVECKWGGIYTKDDN